jgi:hypothetical protein
MALPRLVLSALIILAIPVVAGAQDGPGTPQPGQMSSEFVVPKVDVDRLPVDLNRISRQLLRATTITEERDGLNLRYRVDVYAEAPRIRLFTPADNLTYGPAPWGAPTHRDMLEVMTPQEFRAPAADFGALFRWLADRRGSRR